MGKIKKVNFRNDLWNAEIKGEIKTTQGKITLRCFVPYEEQFIILTMNVTDQENEAQCRFRPQQAISPRYLAQPNRDKGFIYEPNPPFLVKIVEGIEVITQPLLVGDDYATDLV